MKTFSDVELEEFCFDYFLEVLNEFEPGALKSHKARTLIAYAERSGRRLRLIDALKRVQPKSFAAFFIPDSDNKLLRYVAISHAEEDRTRAYWLVTAIGAAGYIVTPTENGILPGHQWHEGVESLLQKSHFFLVLVTPHAVASSRVRQEVDLAIALQRQTRLTVVPLDVADADPPSTWKAYQFIRFRDFSADLPELLSRLAAGKMAQPGLPGSTARSPAQAGLVIALSDLPPDAKPVNSPPPQAATRDTAGEPYAQPQTPEPSSATHASTPLSSLANRGLLLELLVTGFSGPELNELCFHLGVDIDDLPASKREKARELIEYLSRRNRLADLVQHGRRERPLLSWPG